jgi:phenylacetaldehyde dehydrogenase
MTTDTVKPPIAAREPMLVAGAWDEGSGDRIPVENPATEEVLTTVAQATPSEVDAAVAAAVEAHADRRWSGLPPIERGRILERVAQLMERDLEQLAVLEVLDNGKPIERARGDVDFALRTFRHFAGAPTRLTGSVVATAPGQHTYVKHEPVGVAALILPWNFPILTLAWKLAPALAAGATVVVKPAEQTPLTALRVARLCQEAGVPDGVVNVVTGDGAVGAALVDHPGVAKISFTGSTEVGRKVMAAAAETVKRVTLELGGKSPNIVFADADLDQAVTFAIRAIFAHSGQMCTAGSRILVQNSIREEFLDKLVTAVRALKTGNGLEGGVTNGPLVSAEQRDRVMGYIDIGRAEGAEVIVGGRALDRPGYFVEPTIFDRVAPDARIAREEIFGPVLAAFGFDEEDEALAMANDTSYGLAAAVWTKDLGIAHRMADGLRAGTVWVNVYHALDPAVPFGGYGQSGVGRDLGDEALLSYTETKAVTILP